MLFDKDFFWGSSTASYQVEGNINNNWTDWEKKNCKKLAEEANNQYPIDNFICGKAADHYNKYKEDIELMKYLNLNSYRFSIEWARIEPECGKWDTKEIKHYNDVINTLLDNDIMPFVTMYHFTLPKWFPGWDNKESIKYFTRYAKKLIKSFPQVKYWITINEPIIYGLVSYLLGEWEPQKTNIYLFYKVIKNLSTAHTQVYQENINYNIKIGFAKNLMYFRKISFGLGFVKYIWNDWWFNLVDNNYSFIGVNYYIPLDLTWSTASIYYDKCYAKEGNQCIGRSYPQCMRGDPHCTQMEEPRKILYDSEDENKKTDNILYDSEDENNISKFSINGRQKESFSIGDYELTDQRVILIAIIFVCLIMLMNGNLKKGGHGHNNLKYAHTFIPGGYNNISYI